MGERAPYSRVYWTIRNDPRLRDLYPNDHHLSSWLRLLLAADMAWPAPADLPVSVRPSSVRILEAAGVVELLPGGLFVFHGLDAERGRRREAAAASASYRAGTGRTPSGDRTVGERTPDGHLAEPSLAKTRQDEFPPPPAERGRRNDETNPRAQGAAPRQTGSAPRQNGQSPRQERERVKRDPTPIHEILRRSMEVGRDS